MPNRKSWDRTPVPDIEAVRVVERVLEAIKGGHVKIAAVVVVNPLHQAEHYIAGDLDKTGRTSLYGGLLEAIFDLQKRRLDNGENSPQNG